MAEDKHTPGPWRIRNATTGKSVRGKIEVYAKTEGSKPEIIAWPRGGRKTTPANARLIAAACNSYDKHFGPNAVEAAESDLLGEMREVLGEFDDRKSDQKTAQEWGSVFQRVRAILAKTKGTI